MKQQRWVLMIFLLMILLSLLRTKWESLQQLKQQEYYLHVEIQKLLKQKSNQFTSQVKSSPQESPPQMKFDSLMLAMHNGLMIKQWHFLGKLIELEVVGMFQEEFIFLLQLLQGGVELQALEWQPEKEDQISLKLKYRLLPWLKKHDFTFLKNKSVISFFQNNLMAQINLSKHHHDRELSIFTLHFAGMLEQNHKRWALVKWPDRCEQIVMMGQELGVEFAKVVAIHSDHVVLSSRNHKDILIWPR